MSTTKCQQFKHQMPHAGFSWLMRRLKLLFLLLLSLLCQWDCVFFMIMVLSLFFHFAMNLHLNGFSSYCLVCSWCKLHMLAHVLWFSILKPKQKMVFVRSVVYVFTSIANCCTVDWTQLYSQCTNLCRVSNLFFYCLFQINWQTRKIVSVRDHCLN